MSTGWEIKLTEEPDGWWTARELDVGVTTQGKTREAALENLDAVVEAIQNETGRPPTDDELRALDVDPETARTQSDELPDVLQ